MFVGVTLTRKKTGTTIQEYHVATHTYGGPNRAIVDVAKRVAQRYSSDWIISCIQLTEFEFYGIMDRIKQEKRTIEKKTGVRFDEVSTK
jgi:hypothetical protein